MKPCWYLNCRFQEEDSRGRAGGRFLGRSPWKCGPPNATQGGPKRGLKLRGAVRFSHPQDIQASRAFCLCSVPGTRHSRPGHGALLLSGCFTEGQTEARGKGGSCSWLQTFSENTDAWLLRAALEGLAGGAALWKERSPSALLLAAPAHFSQPGEMPPRPHAAQTAGV